MKKLFLFLFLLAFVVACQKDDVKNPVLENQQDKISQLEALGIMPLKDAVPILYTDLCPGDDFDADVAKNSIYVPSNWDFYRFYGVEGDNISINVVRVDCEMDPSFSLFFGTSVTTEGLFYNNSINPDMEFVVFRDDQVPRPASCDGTCYAYGDPGPGVELPHTGWYTLAVHDFISCDVIDPLIYHLSISGIPQCNIIIDGCDTYVRNTMTNEGLMQDVLDGLAEEVYKNHGEYVSTVAHVVNEWYESGLITLEEKDAIMACAAESEYGVPFGGCVDNVVVFRDALPWYSSEYQDEVLDAIKVPWTTATSDDFATYSLDPKKDLVIISADQPQSFYDNLAGNEDNIYDFVKAGGSLIWEVCDWGYNSGRIFNAGIVLPGGVELSENYNLCITNTIVFAGDLLAGFTSPLVANYVSHEGLLNVPGDAIVYCTDNSDNPTLFEFEMGKGKVLISGQTLEWGGHIGNEMRELLPRIYAMMTCADVPELNDEKAAVVTLGRTSAAGGQ